MKKLSKNAKTNYVLNAIYEDLEELGIDEVLRYYNEFKNEIDFNLYQYGNLLIYNYDIEELFRNAGYVSKFDYNEAYKRFVRRAARAFMRDNK